MDREVLLSIASPEIELARSTLEGIVGCKLAVHQSDYRGGDYFRCEVDRVELVLQENFIEDDGEPTEAAFASDKLLVYLDGPDDSVEKLCARLLAGDAHMATLRSNRY
jgi:hypothetical protein